ncbi:MAG: type II toxin-antitoxin system HicA family toxin [Desulfobulbaceae bacterium]|jgi:predicted RNA binding protein YcfA (HicA-like mRNA interferase family)|nr:type II toxin-antitoxin system HicA family toxin [Desulfobulbaceae bacterium]
MLNSREIIRMLEAAGWTRVKAVGDHHQFKHPCKAGKVTVPHPKKDLPIQTLISIEKQSGLKLRK